MPEFTTRKADARIFGTFEECLEYKDTIPTPTRRFCRMVTPEGAKPGDGFVIEKTVAFSGSDSSVWVA